MDNPTKLALIVSRARTANKAAKTAIKLPILNQKFNFFKLKF
jgi:hypothetical protein